MQLFQKYFLTIFLLFFYGGVKAQNPKIDKLEMLYAQRHYRKVYRKANRLLDNPEYDFSVMPTYYRSISLLQLAQNEFWFKKHPDAVKEAKDGLLLVKKSGKGKLIFTAHQNELAGLKEDLIAWGSDLKRMKNVQGFSDVQKLLEVIFEGIIIDDKTVERDGIIEPPTQEESTGIDERSKVVASAEKYIGTPYVWAGSSPNGFDCSGFTSYVLQEFGVQLPRRAEDQYKLAKKIKRKEVQKGDLVFFKNGGSVSHVGIVVSERGEAVVMIHSSSSRGIIETNVDESEYWSKRLYSFGRVLN